MADVWMAQKIGQMILFFEYYSKQNNHIETNPRNLRFEIRKISRELVHVALHSLMKIITEMGTK